MGSDWKTPRLVYARHQQRRGTREEVTYCFITPNFRVIRNVTFNILAPDDWVVFVGFEELSDICRSCINSIESLLTEYVGEMSLNGCDGGSGEVVAEDPK
jgi:hypothetical protein